MREYETRLRIGNHGIHPEDLATLLVWVKVQHLHQLKKLEVSHHTKGVKHVIDAVARTSQGL